jgi:uncharacterized membrane protein YczE
MSKKNKPLKSHLSTSEREQGRKHIYLIIGMIVVGLGVAVYNML